MRARGQYGHIINISSMAGHRIAGGGTGGGFYSATKQAVRCLTESLRQEVRCPEACPCEPCGAADSIPLAAAARACMSTQQVMASMVQAVRLPPGQNKHDDELAPAPGREAQDSIS